MATAFFRYSTWVLGVVLVIHAAQVAVVVQHGLLGLHAVVLYQLAGHAQPHAVLEDADLALGVRGQLPGHGFGLAGLDVQLPIEDVGGAEGANAGLIPLHGSQIVGAGGFQKCTDSFRGKIPPLYLTA